MEKVQIVICDDDITAAEELAGLIKRILEEMNANGEIRIFCHGQDLLREAEEGWIIFLDIEMPDMDGIEVGRRLRDKGLQCPIIMETGVVERFKEAFRIGAFRYITKSYQEDEVREALESVLDTAIGMEQLEVYNNRLKRCVFQKDIDLIRAYNSSVLLEVSGKEFRMEISLVKLESLLDQRLFVRSSKSEIIKMSKVTDINRKGHYVCLGERKCMISGRCQKNFEEKMMHFDLYERQRMR